jgi:hypothetical protein
VTDRGERGTAKPSTETRLPLNHIGVGLALREVLAPWTGHPYDFEVWVRLGVFMQSLQNPYTKLPYYPGLSFVSYPGGTGSIGYLPLSAFVFALTYRLYLVVGEPSRFLYYFLLKQPMVVADVLTAAVLFKIVLQSKDPGSARTVFLVWLYFPLGILISAVWGALDPIALVLILLAAYFFLNMRSTTSACLLGLGIFIKTIPIVALPVFLMQEGMGWTRRVYYSIIALSVPIAGTLIPLSLFNWGFTGLVNYSSFQTAIPVYGAMSIFSALLLLPSIPATVHFVTEILWIPSLVCALAYVRFRRLSLFPGLLVSVLGLSLFRPFLPEQWCIYPLALLLAMFSTENLRHFFGLAIPSSIFFVVNNGFLVRFLSPLSPGFYNWSLNDPPGYLVFRGYVLVLLASLFFLEAFLAVMGRRSLVHRALIDGPLRIRSWIPRLGKPAGKSIGIRKTGMGSMSREAGGLVTERIFQRQALTRFSVEDRKAGRTDYSQ